MLAGFEPLYFFLFFAWELPYFELTNSMGRRKERPLAAIMITILLVYYHDQKLAAVCMHGMPLSSLQISGVHEV
jgi:hypothetical protein